MTNEIEPTTKKCPHCQSDIPAKANKCPNCQSDLRSWFNRHPLLTILGFIIIMPMVIGTISSNGKETSIQTEKTENVSNAFMLASLETGDNNPSKSLIDKFDNLLDNLERKCPTESETQIANYIFKAKTMIEEEGETITLLQAGNYINKSIPEEAIGTVTCAEIAAALIVLSTQ